MISVSKCSSQPVPSRVCLQVIDFCFLSVIYPWFIYNPSYFRHCKPNIFRDYIIASSRAVPLLLQVLQDVQVLWDFQMYLDRDKSVDELAQAEI